MKTLKLTAADFKKTSLYYQEYCGKEDVSSFDGNIEIDANLGYVRFVSINVTGSIRALAGSGIEAGLGIEAGEGIKAGLGIEAGEGIKAGLGIVSFYSWIKAKLKIVAAAECTISAGIFSLSGEQDIEAEEIVGGRVIYGKVKLTPKAVTAKKIVKVKTEKGEVVEGELVD